MPTVNSIVIDGTTLPPLKKGGLTITREKIWSANTGRGANGATVGDLVAIKTKLQLSFPPLSGAQTSALDVLVSKPFFSVTFTDPATNARKTITAYAGTPTYPVYSYSDGVKTYQGVVVDLIEQ